MTSFYDRINYHRNIQHFDSDPVDKPSGDMKRIILFTAGLFMALPVSGAEERFIRLWSNHDEQIMVDDYYEGGYRKKTVFDFPSLPEYGGGLEKPPFVKSQIEAVFLLYSRKSLTILLVTPGNSMKNVTALNDEFRRAITQCRDDKSWIVTLPANRWTEIDLNPYCSMMYEERQIRIILYRTVSSFRPLIEIVTGGLACEPHYLYGWDRKSRGYELKSAKCTGRRRVESLWGGGVNYELLYR